MRRAFNQGLAVGLAAAVQLTALCAAASAGEFKVIYNEADQTGAPSNILGLTPKNGVLYGTTEFGGTSKRCEQYGCGTFFKLTPDGIETILDNFPGGKNAIPFGPLIESLGEFFGVVSGDFSNTSGIYMVTAGGGEAIIHRFKSASAGFDNVVPNLLLAESGLIIGETSNGGDPCPGVRTAGCGTVFEMTKSGVAKILHHFIGGKEGKIPYGGLASLAGNFYGTTLGGGANKDGVFFRLTPSGEYKVLHSFGQSGGANYVDNGLTNLSGKFYGTSFFGGANSDSGNPYGYGCVFSLDKSGNETVLYSFKNGPDGANPQTALLYHGGLFYGLTSTTLFSMTPSGAFTTLQTFNYIGFSSNLVAMGGSVFGFVGQNGTDNQGIVFEYTP